MKAERLIVGAAIVLGAGLFVVGIHGAISYVRYQNALKWPSATAKILDQLVIIPTPYNRMLALERDYLVVKYRFSGPSGDIQGETTARRDSDFYKGASREVRFNPDNPSESILSDQLDQRKRFALGQLLLGLSLALVLFFFAWRVELRRKLEASPKAV